MTKVVNSPCKNNPTRRVCVASNKTCYATKTQARKYRKVIELIFNKMFQMYQCPHCAEWHLTRTNNKWRRNK